MKKLNLSINSRDDALRFIHECEREFTDGINGSVERILSSEHHKIITLAGPTCSGKTTTASILTKRISDMGQNAVVLSLDDFFRDRLDLKSVNGDAPDYDSVNALDLDCLGKFTHELLRGNKVMIPQYSFVETARVGYREYYPRENDIYVFEGIQAVYPEVTSLLEGEYKSIFISVEDDIEYRGVVFSRNELRLLRRIVRDSRFRNATAEFTLHLWDGVRENEENSIFPNAKNCDVYINSFMAYEPFVIADDATELLRTVPADSRYKWEADALIEKLGILEAGYFEDDMVPAASMFREFIG